MTNAQIQTLIISWVDDPNQTYFTPAQTQVWINNAQLQLNLKLIQANESWYSKTVQTALIANQACYLLPSDLERITHMEIVVGGVYPNEQKYTLTHSTPSESDMVNYSPSQPVTFYVEGQNCLVLVPPPDQPYVIRMKYSRLVADMQYSTETPDAPRQYHEFLAILGALDGFMKDQRPSDQFQKKLEYFEGLLKRAATDRMVDKPRMIVNTQDDFGVLF